MIEEDYVSFEAAKLLKGKGFEGRMNTFYTEEGTEMESAYVVPSNFFPIYRPTLQMAMKWLREKELYINVWADPKDAEHDNFTIVYRMMIFNGVSNYGTYEFSSYEQACETAIKYCLENLI